MAQKREWGLGARVCLAILLAGVFAAGCHANSLMLTGGRAAVSIAKQAQVPITGTGPVPEIVPFRRSENVQRPECYRPLNNAARDFDNLDHRRPEQDPRQGQFIVNVAVICGSAEAPPERLKYAYFYAAQALRIVQDHRALLIDQLRSRQAEEGARRRNGDVSANEAQPEPVVEAARLLDVAMNLDRPSRSGFNEFQIRMRIERARVYRMMRQFNAANAMLDTLPPRNAEVKYERAAVIMYRDELLAPVTFTNGARQGSLLAAFEHLQDFTEISATDSDYVRKHAPQALARVAEQLGDSAMAVTPATASSTDDALSRYTIARGAYLAFRNTEGATKMRVRQGLMQLRRAGLLGRDAVADFKCRAGAEFNALESARTTFAEVLAEARGEQLFIPVDAAWGFGCANMAIANNFIDRGSRLQQVRPALEAAVNGGFGVAVNRITPRPGSPVAERLMPDREYLVYNARARSLLAAALHDAHCPPDNPRDTRHTPEEMQRWLDAEGAWRRAVDKATQDDIDEANRLRRNDENRHRFQGPVHLDMADMYYERSQFFGDSDVAELALEKVRHAVGVNGGNGDINPDGDRYPSAQAYLLRGKIMVGDPRQQTIYLANRNTAEIVRTNLLRSANDMQAPQPVRAEAWFYLSELEVQLQQLKTAGRGDYARSYATNAFTNLQSPRYRTRACLVRILFALTGDGLTYCQADEQRDGEEYGESLLREGMFYMRHTFTAGGADQGRSWNMARRSFLNGLNHIRSDKPTADMRVSDNDPTLHLLLEYGRDMALYCAGMGETDNFPNPNQQSAALIYKRWGINRCAARQ